MRLGYKKISCNVIKVYTYVFFIDRVNIYNLFALQSETDTSGYNSGEYFDFIARWSDHGAILTCTAVSPLVPSSPMNNSSKLIVHCKLTFLFLLFV